MQNMSDVIEWVCQKAKVEPGATKPVPLRKLLKRIAGERFAQKEDFVDVLYYSGYGEMRDFDFKVICASFNLRLQSVFDTPGERGVSVLGNRRLSAAEFAELLIRLWRLGLELNPQGIGVSFASLNPAILADHQIGATDPLVFQREAQL